MFCPSIATELPWRICSTCGLYFASKKSVDIHAKALHDRVHKKKNTGRRSTRIKGRRGDEVLCLVQDDETGAQDVEWSDVNDIEVISVWAKNDFTVDDE